MFFKKQKNLLIILLDNEIHKIWKNGSSCLNDDMFLPKIRQIREVKYTKVYKKPYTFATFAD